MDTKINIVIPSYNHYDLTNSLLWSLYQKEYENIDYVLVVDDASTDEEVNDGLNWWTQNGMLPLFSIRNSVNSGFLKTANTGIKIIGEFDVATKPEDVIILISNDVQIQLPFINQIKSILEHDPNTLVGGRLLDWDTGWNQFNQQIFPYLEGWLLATTVGNWTKLGYFDERFVPCDMDDVDLSTTALSLGMKLAPLERDCLVHLGAQTIKYGDKREEQTLKNKEVFRNKWIK